MSVEKPTYDHSSSIFTLNTPLEIVEAELSTPFLTGIDVFLLLFLHFPRCLVMLPKQCCPMNFVRFDSRWIMEGLVCHRYDSPNVEVTVRCPTERNSTNIYHPLFGPCD
jgi:hypothetical protein